MTLPEARDRNAASDHITPSPDAFDDASPSATLGTKVASSAAWVAVSRSGVQLLSFVGSIVLARLLSPADFGIAVYATIVAEFAAAIGSQAVTIAVVTHRNATSEHHASAMAISLLFGISGSVFVLLGSLLIRDEEIRTLVQIASSLFLIRSVGAVSEGTLQRSFRFKEITMAEIANQLTMLVVAVGFAVAGGGAESIVFGIVAGSIAYVALVLRAVPPLRPALSTRGAQEIHALSARAGLMGSVYSVYRNADYLVVGSVFGATSLGLYLRGFQLAIEYPAKLTSVMMSIALPAYSAARDRDERKAIRARIVRLHVTVLFWPIGLLVVIAPTLVPLLYGPAWTASATYAQILCLVGFGSVIVSGSGPLVIAEGHAKASARIIMVSIVVFLGLILWASQYSIAAMCWAAVIHQFLNVLANQLFVMPRYAGVGVAESWADLRPALLAILPMIVVCALVLAGTAAIGLGLVGQTVVPIAIGSLIYWGIVRRWSPLVWGELRGLQLRLRERGAS